MAEKTSKLKPIIVLILPITGGLIVLLFVLSLLLPLFMADKKKNPCYLLHTLNTLTTATTMTRNMGNEYSCRSAKTADLTECIAKPLVIANKTYNKITMLDGTTTLLIFSDNNCTTKNSCFVTIDINGAKSPNQEYNDQLSVPIYFEDDNTIGIYQEDYDNLVNHLNLDEQSKRICR